MALNVNRKELDEFCPRLFRTLDELGLLPLNLRKAKPNELEKYPRLLFGSIQRYNDVEAGFKEWESRVLRQDEVQYRKEERYPSLDELRRQMAQNANLFTNKTNLQHLRTSLYARVFQYLYPRRVLVNAYCVKHKGNPAAIEPEFVAGSLPGSIEIEVEKLKQTYVGEWEAIAEDARVSLIANRGYYRKVLEGKESLPASEEPVESEIEEIEQTPEEE
jgi:hypothetical protein